MSALSNKSSSHRRCVEATLPFSAVAQRLQIGREGIIYNLKKIAEESGCSISTVSRVINGKGKISKATIERVMKIAQEHNYVPNQVARSLKNSKTNTIGVIVPDIRDYFYMFIKAADSIFFDAGYSILLADSDENPEKEDAYIKLMYEKRVDGLILATVSENHEALDMYFRSSVPVIFIDNLPNIDPAYEDCVILDNSRASAMAIEAFVKEGHTRIAIISGNERETTGMERVQGYIRSMERHGLEVNPQLMKKGNFQDAGGYSCMKELIRNREREPFTAVYVSSYKMTCGALRAIKEDGLKIPQDMAVIGFDFIDNTGLMSPAITTIVQPIENIGSIVARRLLARIKAGEETGQGEQIKDIAQKIILSPDILMGESSRLVRSKVCMVE